MPNAVRPHSFAGRMPRMRSAAQPLEYPNSRSNTPHVAGALVSHTSPNRGIPTRSPIETQSRFEPPGIIAPVTPFVQCFPPAAPRSTAASAVPRARAHPTQRTSHITGPSLRRITQPANPAAQDHPCKTHKVRLNLTLPAIKQAGLHIEKWRRTQRLPRPPDRRRRPFAPTPANAEPAQRRSVRPASHRATSRAPRRPIAPAASTHRPPTPPGRIHHAPLPWHCLYFFPLPHGHGALRPTFGCARRIVSVLVCCPCARIAAS